MEGFTLTSEHTHTNGHIENQRQRKRDRAGVRLEGTSTLLRSDFMENVSSSDLNIPLPSDRAPASHTDPTGDFWTALEVASLLSNLSRCCGNSAKRTRTGAGADFSCQKTPIGAILRKRI